MRGTAPTPSRLDRARLEGDEAPDALVGAFMARGEVGLVNRLLRRLEGNEQPVPVELPDDLEDWLRASARLPPEVDEIRLARAAELFVEHGLQMSLIMSTASLVWCYAATKGVKALMFTGRLQHSPYHRAAETSQFVLQVLGPDGLADGGTGIRAAQKVRLLHASLRHLIRQSGRWDEASLGVPLCQEDMALALLTFSIDVVDGLARLGVELEPEQAEDYLYAWGVIGSLLGVRQDLIPPSVADARRLKATIARRQYGPSDEGVLLTRALLEMHDRVIPGEAFDGLIPALTRLLVGHRVADWLAIPRGRWDRLLRHYALLGRFLERVDRSAGSLGNLVDEYAYRSLTRISISATGYERAAFEIPTALATAWASRPAVHGPEDDGGRRA
jgi:hypothetical protein